MSDIAGISRRRQRTLGEAFMLVSTQKGARTAGSEGGHPKDEGFFNQERPGFTTVRGEERDKIDFTGADGGLFYEEFGDPMNRNRKDSVGRR
jgi:hypothetical protein